MMGSASSTHDDIVATLKDAGLDPAQVRTLIEATFAEDLRWGPDVTTEAIFGDERATAQVVSRAHGTLAGVPVGAYALHLMAPYSPAHHLAGQSYSPAHRLTSQGSHETQVHVQMRMADGERVHPGDVVLTVEGPVHTLLTAERTMLNLVSQLSGVATATAAWVDALAGSPTKVRDTRKTVPGLRVLQKYAVRCGGGVNHRMGLGDAALVKDNHIAAAGSVAAALAAVHRHAPEVDCEVECDRLDQVSEAIEAGAQLVLLDNMSPDLMAQAVALARPAGVRTEASGGLRLDDAPAVAATGVDFVAVGALTHSAPVLDLGLDLLG